MLGLSKFLHEDPNLANQLGQTKKKRKNRVNLSNQLANSNNQNMTKFSF